MIAFRERWMTRGCELAELLALPHALAPASDPFFGRTGKLLAMSQIEQAAKFEPLIPVRRGEAPDDFFNPKQLNPLARSYLREAFRAVASVQAVLAGELSLGVRWG